MLTIMLSIIMVKIFWKSIKRMLAYMWFLTFMFHLQIAEIKVKIVKISKSNKSKEEWPLFV